MILCELFLSSGIFEDKTSDGSKLIAELDNAMTKASHLGPSDLGHHLYGILNMHEILHPDFEYACHIVLQPIEEKRDSVIDFFTNDKSKMPDDAKELIRGMTASKVADRWDIDQVLKHRWVTSREFADI